MLQCTKYFKVTALERRSLILKLFFVVFLLISFLCISHAVNFPVDSSHTWIISKYGSDVPDFNDPDFGHPTQYPFDLTKSFSEITDLLDPNFLQDGDRIIIFPGEYIGQIDLSSYTGIRLEGINENVKIRSDSGHTLIMGEGCKVTNISIDCNDSSAMKCGIYANEVNDISIYDCDINARQIGIYFTECQRTNLKRCNINGGAYGYYISGSGDPNHEYPRTEHSIKNCMILTYEASNSCVAVNIVAPALINIESSIIKAQIKSGQSGIPVALYNVGSWINISKCNIYSGFADEDEPPTKITYGAANQDGRIHIIDSLIEVSDVNNGYSIYNTDECYVSNVAYDTNSSYGTIVDTADPNDL